MSSRRASAISARVPHDRDDDPRAPHDEQVAALPQTCRHGDVDPLVGRVRVDTRQHADDLTTGRLRAARGCRHHAAEPAGDDDRAGAGQPRPDGFGVGEQLLVGDVTGSDDGDLRRTAYGGHCWRKQMSTSHLAKPSRS